MHNTVTCGGFKLGQVVAGTLAQDTRSSQHLKSQEVSFLFIYSFFYVQTRCAWSNNITHDDLSAAYWPVPSAFPGDPWSPKHGGGIFASDAPERPPSSCPYLAAA